MKLPLTIRLAYCSRKKKGGLWLWLRESLVGSLLSNDMAVADKPGDKGIWCEEPGARFAGLCMVGEGVLGLGCCVLLLWRPKPRLEFDVSALFTKWKSDTANACEEWSKSFQALPCVFNRGNVYTRE